MSTSRRFLSLALLLPLVGLAGCDLLFSGGSPGASHSSRGGFTVSVDGPGQPGSAGVLADVGTFAQRHGYTRQAAEGTTQRYVSGNVFLDVSRDPAEHRVTAYLHSVGTGNDRKAIDRFYEGFAQEYGGRYGGAAHLSETAYADDAGTHSGLLGKPVETKPGDAARFTGAGQ